MLEKRVVFWILSFLCLATFVVVCSRSQPSPHANRKLLRFARNNPKAIVRPRRVLSSRPRARIYLSLR